MSSSIGDAMVKCISLKAGVLFGVSLLCLGGSGLLLSMGRVEMDGFGPASETLRFDELVEQVRGLDVRILGIERLLGEGTRGVEGEVATFKQQFRALQFLVKDHAKRLEHHEKEVDNRVEKTDNIANVEKQAASKRSPVLSRSIYHVVKDGETLYRISKRYTISERELIRLNGLKDKTRIFIGQTLRITP